MNDVFQPVFRNIEIDGENGSQLFLKTSLGLGNTPSRVLYISTGGRRILDETLPLVIRVSLFILS